MNRLLGVLFFACAAACAGEPLPDLSKDLYRARDAWQQGDALGAKAREAAAQNRDCLRLLEEQEKAYAYAEKAFAAALEKDPNNPLAMVEFGRFWISRHQFAKARLRLEAACNSPRVKSAFTEPELADAFRTLAGLLERAGEFNTALDYYQRALKLSPADARNRLSLAVALSASGRAHETIKLLQPWLEATGASADEQGVPKKPAQLALAHYTLAVALEDAGFAADALKHYHKAKQQADGAGAGDTLGVGEYSDLSIARLEDFHDAQLAQAQERQKENEARKTKNLPPLPEGAVDAAKAGYLCDQAIELKERALADSAFVRALQRARSGLAADADSLVKEPGYDSLAAAMNLLNEAIVKAPRMARAHYELAVCNVLVSRYSTARALLDAAAIYSPHNIAILNLKAEVLIEMGQWEEAARAYTTLLALDPESAPANFGLARAYAALQRDLRECQTALNALDRALQLGLRDPRAFSNKRLVCKDGLEFARFRQEGTDYIVSDGDVLRKIPGAEVAEIRNLPGLREKLERAVERFERGEAPAPIPTLKGTTRETRRGPDVPSALQGTIFDR